MRDLHRLRQERGVVPDKAVRTERARHKGLAQRHAVRLPCSHQLHKDGTVSGGQVHFARREAGGHSRGDEGMERESGQGVPHSRRVLTGMAPLLRNTLRASGQAPAASCYIAENQRVAKRPSFTTRKTAFCMTKDGFPQAERRPSAAATGRTDCTETRPAATKRPDYLAISPLLRIFAMRT